MGSRGRVSSASLAVVGIDGALSVPRPAAPADLSEEQRAEWAAVVNRMPADWFGAETLPLLAQYCRHVVAARRISHLIGEAETGEQIDLNEYDRLLKMQEREGRAMSSLATRMRLTQQATYDRTKRKPTMRSRPWESAG